MPHNKSYTEFSIEPSETLHAIKPSGDDANMRKITSERSYNDATLADAKKRDIG